MNSAHIRKENHILVDGKRHIVKLLRVDDGPPYLVGVDDKTYEVQPLNELKYDPRVSMKVGGRHFRVELERVNKSKPFSVRVNNKLFKVEYETLNRIPSKPVEPTTPTTPRRPIAKLGVDKGVVAASLPGRVVSLKVKVGDSVEKGDALCVLEAMKMENEIVAPMAGVVQEVVVLEGASVNRGDALFLIK
ncbi:MAG: biotin/lipoyl-containing protein [Candidatus Bathyarchaeia archaeon]